MRTFLTLIFCLSFLHFLQAQKSILFIGNSLSYSNELPALLSEVALANQQKWKATCLCYPNYGLEDHVSDPKTKQIIKEGNYDWVIFQQGPSSQAYGRSSLMQFGDSISRWSKATGAESALMMVWTSEKWSHTWPLVIQNHKDAASQIESHLLPVGEVWKEYQDRYPDHGLYAADNFHPSLFGSQIAALIIYQSIHQRGDDPMVPERWRFSKNRKKRVYQLVSN